MNTTPKATTIPKFWIIPQSPLDGEQKSEGERRETHPPDISERVTIAQLDKPVSIHRATPSNTSHRRADLIRDTDILIPRSTRHKRRTLSIERVELVRHQALETPAQWIDVRYPAEGADHRGFGDGVTGVEYESEEEDTSDGLSGGGSTKAGSDGAEPGFHGERHRQDENEERAKISAIA